MMRSCAELLSMSRKERKKCSFENIIPTAKEGQTELLPNDDDINICHPHPDTMDVNTEATSVM